MDGESLDSRLPRISWLSSIRGEFSIEATSPEKLEQVLADVERELRKARARLIKREGSRISFRGRIHRPFWGWSLLAMIDRGAIEVVPGSPAVVRYHFSCLDGLILSGMACGVMLVILVLLSGFTACTMFAPLTLWVALYGLNFFITWIRATNFVYRAAGQEPPEL